MPLGACWARLGIRIQLGTTSPRTFTITFALAVWNRAPRVPRQLSVCDEHAARALASCLGGHVSKKQSRAPKKQQANNQATKAETRISVYPGIEIVAQPGASTIVVGAIQDQLAQLRLDFVQEQIAELLGKCDDRYEVARILQESPERIEQIAKIVQNARAS
jgi:hypothetical protein